MPTLPTTDSEFDKWEIPRQKSERLSAHKRGYDKKWSAARLRHLAKFPLCNRCEDKGILNTANVVDHIVPHKGDKKLFWDRYNWQSLCTFHHNQKTGRGK